ncbi:8531_t:CDS:2 [Cetraspora pellucida]|uniref:8531_t:CDS:1 n=1 Tax=Cetraspora pellucida TaxID=1433469 RepID=A0ACA9PAZ2_9GLOM|nr:8531_t:CDS:2 [Cetraspora pellucida]
MQSLCYDVFSINDWQLLLEMTNNFYQKDMAREDNYDQQQFLFSLLLENIPHDLVQEVWKIVKHSRQNSEL